MTITEAFKTKRPIRLKNKTWSYIGHGWMNERRYIFPDAWIDPEFFLDHLHMTRKELLSNDWEVKPTKKSKKR